MYKVAISPASRSEIDSGVKIGTTPRMTPVLCEMSIHCSTTPKRNGLLKVVGLGILPERRPLC